MVRFFHRSLRIHEKRFLMKEIISANFNSIKGDVSFTQIYLNITTEPRRDLIKNFKFVVQQEGDHR